MIMLIGSDGKRGALSQVVARIIAAPANENDPALCNASRFVLVGWGEEDAEYINMVDNNRVFFECLLEQVSQCTRSRLSTLSC